MPEESKRHLKVFLCHASQDKPAVRELYWRLVHDGVNVWLDETNLLPGMEWQLEIPKAVRQSDVIIICLSNQSVTKEGYVQKEIRFALDIADEKPEGTIYLIPVRLDACEIPSRLSRWQWVDMFSSDGYRKLRISLRLRADSMGAALYSANRKPEKRADLPTPGNSYSSNEASASDRILALKLLGRVFGILASIFLVCAAIFWAGKWLINTISQVPAPTLMPSASPTLEIATVQPEVPTWIAPSQTPFEPPTPFQPLPTSIFPTQAPATITSTATFPVMDASPAMSLIPAGSFKMGNDAGFADEKPANTIYLDAFYLDQYEVTNRQYSDCVKSGVCQMPSTANLPDGYFNNYPVAPVVNVAWGMAKTYCEWRGGRLPTEAEWEKAARGGLVDMLYPWGNAAPSCNNGTLNGARLDECKGDGPIVVGSYQPNGYQLYDMIGNVSEWVNDWYASDYYALGPSISPEATGPSTGTKRVVRGGSWDQTHTIISVSARGKNTPETQSNQIGFRCARDTAP